VSSNQLGVAVRRRFIAGGADAFFDFRHGNFRR
jgi:hypothetical protein